MVIKILSVILLVFGSITAVAQTDPNLDAESIPAESDAALQEAQQQQQFEKQEKQEAKEANEQAFAAESNAKKVLTRTKAEIAVTEQGIEKAKKDIAYYRAIKARADKQTAAAQAEAKKYRQQYQYALQLRKRAAAQAAQARLNAKNSTRNAVAWKKAAQYQRAQLTRAPSNQGGE